MITVGKPFFYDNIDINYKLSFILQIIIIKF